jgi:hypothetical protein
VLYKTVSIGMLVEAGMVLVEPVRVLVEVR